MQQLHCPSCEASKRINNSNAAGNVKVFVLNIWKPVLSEDNQTGDKETDQEVRVMLGGAIKTDLNEALLL